MNKKEQERLGRFIKQATSSGASKQKMPANPPPKRELARCYKWVDLSKM